MLIQNIYYLLKPLLPWDVRMALRRPAARRKRAATTSVWPIKQIAGRTPAGWPGWPGGKKFALVLTHDVEGPSGLAKCRKLMKLEQELGFVSSFNLIPEGPYEVPPELRSELAQNGFEVGVHDLKHDGKLFGSQSGFARKAPRINHYLREWGAQGFRAGFMLRNLDWLHQLDIRYDMSTFDTDPFEMQSDGMDTIFPFWIPTPSSASNPGRAATDPDGAAAAPLRNGYVELPYTLPQDSTVFMVHGETSPDIWTNKLDWIARHGGMALVNVHPDYLQFDGEPASAKTFPVKHYLRFLQHARENYGDVFWQPLPRQMAEYVAQIKPLARKSRTIGMVTHSFYESDNRVVRYAETLAARGDTVNVFALRRSPQLPKMEVIEGVNVFRIQDRFGKNERSKFSYFWPLVRFLAVSSWWLTRSHLRKKYDLLHIHNIPDFLIFSACYPKLTGTPVVLDVHDIVPEFFSSKFGTNNKGAAFTLLKLMERVSAAMADQVIIANHLWLETYMARTHTRGRCTAFINNVDSGIFAPVPRKRNDGKLIILFPGGLQWHQGLDIAIRAFGRIRAQVPNAEFHIYGDGNAKESLVALTAELNLNDRVKFFEPLNVRKIAAIMADADLGVVPKRADSFGNEAYSTKIMEFMSVGVPVVIANTKIDRYYFNDSIVRFFESGNDEALATEMLDLLGKPETRQRLAAAALQYAADNCWNTRKVEYLALVDNLIERK